MVATVLLWKTGGETSCTVAAIQVGECGHSGSSASHSPITCPHAWLSKGPGNTSCLRTDETDVQPPQPTGF